MQIRFLNISVRRVGGITFVRLGRIFLSYGVSRALPAQFDEVAQ